MSETNGWLTIPDAYAALVFARAGFDSVTLDMQHGLFDEAAVVGTLLALSGERPRRIVRTAANDAAMLGKALDAGADGVIAPLVSTVADAVALAGACHYPPRGARSFGPVVASLRPGYRPDGDTAGIEVWAMIETREGLEQVEAIAGVEGVTGLYVGPNDLALALGYGPGPDRTEPALLEAFARIVGSAHAAGKRAGLFCASGAYARQAQGIGFDVLTVASDSGALRHGAASALASFAG